MPQGIDEDYNGAPDAMEAGGPDPIKLRMLLAKLVEMLGLGDASDPANPNGSEGAPLPPEPPFLDGPDEGDDQTAIENDMRGGTFDEVHGTDLEGSGSFQPPAGNKAKLDAFRSKLKAGPAR